MVLIITALLVGAVLAVGASIATSAVVGSSVPSNRPAYNYGSN